MMNSGRILAGSPCLGSWVNYGLGSENENLPGFVVMLDPTGGPISGAKNWSSGYMPAAYQGTVLRADGRADPRPGRARRASTARPAAPPARPRSARRTRTTSPRAPTTPSWPPGSPATSWPSRCSSHAPEAVDFARRRAETLALYGIDQPADRRLRPQVPAGPPAGRARRALHPALLRRRPQRRQLGRPRRPRRRTTPSTPADTDKPIAGLLTDLKRRGLLDETLIVWGGEFGRQPTAEYAKGTGRDHNAYGFTMWMAGGGIKGGISVGADRRARHRRRRGPLPRQEPARHDPAPAGPRPQRPDLLLRRPRPEARRRRRGRADPADHLSESLRSASSSRDDHRLRRLAPGAGPFAAARAGRTGVNHEAGSEAIGFPASNAEVE